MKVAIVDDAQKETELLTQYVTRFSAENHIEISRVVFHNPLDFVEKYSGDYDLILLDVEMPGLNGIDTAREIRRMDSRVVIMFITNMAQYAINGYEVEAVDYVLKPVTYQDFAMKLKKAARYIQRNQDMRLTLTTSDGMVNIHVSDIYYLEVDRHYLIYHTVHGDYTVRGVMRDVEEQMQEYHFVRCNHCYLVNLKYVEAVNGTFVRVGGTELQMSRNKKNEFLQAFTRYVGGM